MAVPILLVTGFLGAGKTTVVNHLLTQAHGKRIAAVVNDFGSINIDAELIADATDDVISLSNGCVCCSLEGELIRTLAALLKRDPKPEMIVIESSGVANPADIVSSLMDPFIWKEAPLEQVLCVVDGAAPIEELGDPLKQSQLRAADLVAITKLDLEGDEHAQRNRDRIRTINPTTVIVEAQHGNIPSALLLPVEIERTPRAPEPRPHADDRFETQSWTSDRPLSLGRFQKAIEILAPKVVRAKGLIALESAPEKQMVFQLSGGRAALAPRNGAAGPLEGPLVRMVFIAEKGCLPTAEFIELMDGCVIP